MNILIKIIVFWNLLLFNLNPVEYNYTLICTGKTLHRV